MVDRLWVPLSHSLRARNWNCAAAGCALTASRVAKSVGTSTPLSAVRVCVLVMMVLLRGDGVGCLPGHRESVDKLSVKDARHPPFPGPSPRDGEKRRSAEGEERTLTDMTAHRHPDGRNAFPDERIRRDAAGHLGTPRRRGLPQRRADVPRPRGRSSGGGRDGDPWRTGHRRSGRLDSGTARRRPRKRRLTASLAAVDVHEHHWLGYRDGMLPQVPAGEAIGQITALIAAVRPDTIVTFGPDGMTGHPDHRTVSGWVTAGLGGNRTRGAALVRDPDPRVPPGMGRAERRRRAVVRRVGATVGPGGRPGRAGAVRRRVARPQVRRTGRPHLADQRPDRTGGRRPVPAVVVGRVFRRCPHPHHAVIPQG